MQRSSGHHEKRHNSSRGMDAKIDLRRRVLGVVKPAHVFDCFCGPDGEMWRGAWREAAGYVGCDLEHRWQDPRARFVGDTYTVLRSVDLQAYNVFDVDTFGCPWTALLIIAARRRWASGETGAIVVTDGGWLNSRMGLLSRPFQEAAGLNVRVNTASIYEDARALAFQRWLTRCQVSPLHIWKASLESGGVGEGSSRMAYLALVFRGL